MKKKLLVAFLATISTFAFAFGLAACGSSNGGGNNEDNSHVHTYAEEWTINATHHWHASTCGHTDEVSGKAEHTWGNGYCSVCGRKDPSATSWGLKYTQSDDGTYYSVTGIGMCTDTDVVIPSTYNDKPVTSIGNSAFYNCSSLTSVTIPDSVTSIGYEAFYYCSSLTSVTIPNSVTRIGSSAFKKCSSLTSIKVDENNQSYKSIDGNLYTKDGARLIQYAIGKTETSFVIPDSVKSIGYEAFYYCSSLMSVTIPDSVTSIENYAFSDCSRLTSVTFGENSKLTSIGGYAFYWCSRLTSVTIPNRVTSIGGGAFSSCGSLKSVVIPDGVTSVGESAFRYCSNLTSITIPDSVTSIGNSAFSDCIRLTSVTIPNRVTSIGGGAFSSCSSLTSVTIPSSVKRISEETFYKCSSLTSITIPDSVTSIGERAFYDCSNLTEINYNATQCADLSSYNYVFSGAGQSGTGITVTIGANVKKIPAYLFCPYSSAPKITSVVFEEGSVCESIGNCAFRGCYSLTSVTIGNSVTSIGIWAFNNCSSLTSVTFKNTSGWQHYGSSTATSTTNNVS